MSRRKGKPEIPANIVPTSLAWLASLCVTLGRRKLDDDGREMLVEAIADVVHECGLDTDALWEAIRDAEGS